MKKVLIITCQWPPTSGGGALRWLKLCKYLPDFGWEPVVYTPEKPDEIHGDESLNRDVLPGQVVVKLPFRKPSGISVILTGALGGSSGGSRGGTDQILYLDRDDRTWSQNALVWTRSNLIIPDSFASWIEPSIEFLAEYLTYNPVDAMVSSGPPHSTHLIARGVKQRLDLPWIADFRSPWTRIVYDDRFLLTNWARKKHESMERSVIEKAEVVVDTAPTSTRKLSVAGAGRVETITDGYDPGEVRRTRILPTGKFRINHTGTLSPDRNHRVLWEALRAISKSVIGFQGELEIELVGRVNPSVTSMAARYGFGSNLLEVGYVEHAEAVDRMSSSHILLLLINRAAHNQGFVPTTLYEYLAAGRPILMIGPRGGDAENILAKTGAGRAVSVDDFHDTKTVIADWYQMHKDRELQWDSTGIETYSWRNLTERMAALLDDLTGHHRESHSRESGNPSRENPDHTST